MNGNRPEDDGTRTTSEFVHAPGFGETAPPAPPPLAVPVVTSGPSASNPNTAIIAVLVFALLVIVGGTVVLLATDIGAPGGVDRTSEATVAPADASTTSAPAATAPPPSPTPAVVEPDPLPPITAPTDTAPSSTVTPSTAPPSTVAPNTVAPNTVAPSTVAPSTVAPSTVAPSTAPPSTAPPSTAPPTTPIPVAAIDPATGRGFGDLGLEQPVLAEPCSGSYVTFVFGIAGGTRPYSEQMQRGLDAFPGSNYVWGGMCPSLRQFNDNGDEIYGVVYGPFASAGQACDLERQFASEGAYVRRLDTVDPVGRDDHCG